MGANGIITKTSWTTVSKEEKVVVSHISEIQAAIAKLEGYAKNVDNCGFTNYCQTCQSVTLARAAKAVSAAKAARETVVIVPTATMETIADGKGRYYSKKNDDRCSECCGECGDRYEEDGPAKWTGCGYLFKYHRI